MLHDILPILELANCHDLTWKVKLLNKQGELRQNYLVNKL